MLLHILCKIIIKIQKKKIIMCKREEKWHFPNKLCAQWDLQLLYELRIARVSIIQQQ